MAFLVALLVACGTLHLSTVQPTSISPTSPTIATSSLTASVADSYAPTSATTTATFGTPTQAPTTPPPSRVCPDLVRCLGDVDCAACIDIIRPLINASGEVFSPVVSEVAFFTAVNAPPCSVASVGSHPLIVEALVEVYSANPVDATCHLLARITREACVASQIGCSLHPDCNVCLTSIYSNLYGNHSVQLGRVFNSPSCLNASLSIETLASGDHSCSSFPACSFGKWRVSRSTDASACWASLQQGDAAAAVTSCHGGQLQDLVDDTVSRCLLEVPTACEYWRLRCAALPGCAQCLQTLDSRMSMSKWGIVDAMSSEQCRPAMTENGLALSTLVRYFQGCPQTTISQCDRTVFVCMVMSGSKCESCLNGSTSGPACDGVLTQKGFNVDGFCAQCSETVLLINRIVLATSVIGGVSVVACICIIVSLVAYSRDLVSLRDRLIIGLMVSNCVYSTANAIPMGSMHTDARRCGELVLSMETIRFGRAFWFGGKFGLVCYEIFVLGMSIVALQRGSRSVTPRLEAGLHLGCVCGGFAAFAGFYIVCGDIMRSGYNDATQSRALSPYTVDYLSVDDDQNDLVPGASASRQFDSARGQFDTLEQTMLQIWLGLLGLAIAIWLGLRWQFTRLHSAWRRMRTEAEADWDRDLWAQGSEGERQMKKRLLDMVKDGFEEVARPLEPFVAVFVLWGVPAMMMATDFCQYQSGATAGTSRPDTLSSSSISYGTCDVWCELALSLRSLATVTVYLSWREYRMEMFAVRTLRYRLWNRIAGCVWPALRHPRVRFHSVSKLEEVLMIPRGRDEDSECDPDNIEG